jgi:hypothetical protein
MKLISVYMYSPVSTMVSLPRTPPATSKTAHLTTYNPEPAHSVAGRRYQYDGATSSHGDRSCALCHVFGDMDQLSWDLGSLAGSTAMNPSISGGEFNDDLVVGHARFGLPENPHFAPLKGPIATQSLRGLAGHGPMHWRGNKTDGSVGGDNYQADTSVF